MSPALFDTGFFVRKPAWHGEGLVLMDYPGREEAKRLAGHDFLVLELPSFTTIPFEPVLPERATFVNEDGKEYAEAEWKYAERCDEARRTHAKLLALAEQQGFVRTELGYTKQDPDNVSHARSDTLAVLHKPKDSYEPIQNEVAYEIAELMFKQGFEYETGITLDGGKTCALTLMLNEPIVITGDDSPVLPFGAMSWSHDGSASFRVRAGTIRQVCANTVAASEAEGKRLGTDFTFRHTKNVHERIEDAKEAIKGVRAGIDVFREAMEDLAKMPVTPEQRDLFVSTIIGDAQKKGLPLSQRADTSAKVKGNIEAERAKINSLFFGPTIPEAHQLTGYGLFQAGTEYFDHLRAYRSPESYVKRTLLKNNPAKAALSNTIREVVAA